MSCNCQLKELEKLSKVRFEMSSVADCTVNVTPFLFDFHTFSTLATLFYPALIAFFILPLVFSFVQSQFTLLAPK